LADKVSEGGIIIPYHREIMPRAVRKAMDGDVIFAPGSAEMVTEMKNRQSQQNWMHEILADAAVHFWLYRKHPWIRICTELIVQAATSDLHTIDSLSGDERGKEAMRTWLRYINKKQNFERFLRGVYRDQLINGNYYARKQFMGRALVSLNRIDFRTIVPEPHPTGIPENYYIYRNGVYTTRPEKVPAVEILHLTLNDMGECGMGMSYLDALDFTLGDDQAAIKYNTGFFLNGAKAGDIYQIEDAVDPDRAERERQYIVDNFTSPASSFTPMVLTGKTKLLRDGSALRKDMEFVEEIAGVYSVPLSLITGQVGALGANGKEQDRIMFDEYVVAPLQKQNFEDINRQIIQDPEVMNNDDIVLLPPIATKTRLDLLDAANKLVSVGGTGNQALRVLNLPEVEGLDEPLFLGSRAFGVVGKPGHADSILLTQRGAMSSDPQDPLEIVGKAKWQIQGAAGPAAAGQGAGGVGPLTSPDQIQEKKPNKLQAGGSVKAPDPTPTKKAEEEGFFTRLVRSFFRK
jgi:hypothetical protein